MIKWLKDLFNDIENTPKQQDSNHVVAALLLEVARADDHIHTSEKALLENVLLALTKLPLADVKTMMEQAQKTVEDAESIHKFTQHINLHYSLENKLNLLLQLWQMAYADGEIDRYEEHIIRKISDLLHLRHSEYIQCKLNAKNAQPNTK
jgi:uncharacterized tellurite resistance protein B-like protein